MAESLHHVHLFADDIDATVGWWREHLGGEVIFDGEFGSWRYIMCPAPDGVLLELFEADASQMEGDAARYFAD